MHTGTVGAQRIMMLARASALNFTSPPLAGAEEAMAARSPAAHAAAAKTRRATEIAVGKDWKDALS